MAPGPRKIVASAVITLGALGTTAAAVAPALATAAPAAAVASAQAPNFVYRG